MPLQCSSCRNQLKELSLIASSLSGVRIAVVAPSFETYNVVSHIQTEFPRLIVDRDVGSLWSSNDANNYDQILFDRCGRVSHAISHPRSDVTSYRDTLNAIKSALYHAQCGWCQYDSKDPTRHENGHKTAKSVNAYLKPRTPGYYSGEQDIQINQRRKSSYEQTTMYNPTRLDQTTYYNRNRQSQPTSYYSAQPINNHSMSREHHNDYSIRYQQQNFFRPESTQNKALGQIQKQPEMTEEFRYDISARHSSTTAPSKSGYGPDEDYGDYGLPQSAGTTPILQTQISPPTPPNPFWPTPPYRQIQKNHITRQYQIDQPFGPIIGENNIPCSAYTDDICYQQQEKLGRSGLSKCCSKGIYFTDLCISGRCSNSTTQLCCFQKFLQAKFACCADPSQSEGTTSTNQFNKCCHQKFVSHDDCCSQEAAFHYWNSVHEICYPNTKVDYSKIKMEVRFAEGVRVVDLGENRLWDYECQYGEFLKDSIEDNGDMNSIYLLVCNQTCWVLIWFLRANPRMTAARCVNIGRERELRAGPNGRDLPRLFPYLHNLLRPNGLINEYIDLRIYTSLLQKYY
uniref:SelP_N domain-containing protein n=1 Tax=Heterorhabditis bacteriophora TaxID=37862 RepID=A0A1I7XTF3_HETBA